MSDVRLICVDCQQPFEWTYGEQRFYRERKLEQPTHCQACRERRRRARDVGMQSEVGPIAPFFDADEERWNSLLEQAQIPPVQTPEPPYAQAPRVSVAQKPTPQPRSSPPAWSEQIDVRAIAAFVWLVVTIVVFQLFGWPAAAVVVALGVALVLWRISKP
jgi:hypothetical protein